MAKTLLGEIAIQIFGLKRKKYQPRRNPRDKAYEQFQYKMKEAAFEAKKEFEIAKLKAKSKGWT